MDFHYFQKYLDPSKMVKNEELSKRQDSQEQYGVILGYWDQEKTPTLITDLEESVNLVETKCKKLLQELLQYKKYLEESQNPEFNFPILKKKISGSYGSDPDITFRKNLLNSEEFKKVFEENFQLKLSRLHNELTNAANKIGLRDNVLVFPKEETFKFSNEHIQDEIEKYWSYAREEFIKAHCLQTKAKSDPNIWNNEEVSKITKDELELYQKLSRISLNKNRARKWLKRVKVSPVGKKTKFGHKKKRKPRVRILEDLEEVSVIKKRKIKSPSVKNRKNKLTVPVKNKKLKRTQSHSPQRSHSTISSQKKSVTNDFEIETMCNSLVEVIRNKNLPPLTEKPEKRETPVDPPNFRPLSRKVIIPFTAGTSTSKSHNIGTNIQQFLSKEKHSRKPGTKWQPPSTKIPEPRESHSVGARTLNSSHVINDSFEVSQVEHKGKVWISKRCTSSDFRKVRSKYTGSSPESFLGYHKSTMRQYTNGQKSMIKSESKTAYAVGSKIMVSDCQRTDFFEIDKGVADIFQHASGDGTCNENCAKLKLEWSKVFSSFLDVYRKYIALKEQVSNNDMKLSDVELQSLEKEIDSAVDKYKEFLKFYSKFLHLKHRLKSLKIACESNPFGPVTSFTMNSHRRLDSCRPTYSMTMRKAFREVQALQEKIKLVADY